MKNLVLILACLLFFYSVVQANGFPTAKEEWVTRYNSPDDYQDYAYAIAIDSSDNVCVTGSSKSLAREDYATIKYDPNGNELWAARYNWSSNKYDIAHAIVIDSSDNIYVTGRSYDLSTDYDYATIKYDPNGTELWVARYDGPANDSDWAWAMAIDSSDNVYVTGGSNSDYATIKYDPNGTELWVARYNWLGWGEFAYAMAIDSSDNVYVTGYSIGPDTAHDYATIKYDPNGTELWVARYDGPANSYDVAEAIAIDSSNNVYVTGSSDSNGFDVDDYATIKYDPNGTELWVARYGQANSHDVAKAIAIDNSDNVYVTGYTIDALDDYATIKYDPNGTELWVARYNGLANDSDSAWAMAIDSSDNVCVTGRSIGPGTSYDYATIKYSQIFCTSKPAMDFNNDCKVDFQDFALFVQGWLDCNLDPPEVCWE